MRKMLLVALLSGSLVLSSGCESLNGGDKVMAANIVLNQLDATLDSVEIALEEINGEPLDSEAFRIIQITLKVAKPQIVAWIDTIAMLQAADAQYGKAVELKARAEAVLPQIDLAVIAK